MPPVKSSYYLTSYSIHHRFKIFNSKLYFDYNYPTSPRIFVENDDAVPLAGNRNRRICYNNAACGARVAYVAGLIIKSQNAIFCISRLCRDCAVGRVTLYTHTLCPESSLSSAQTSKTSTAPSLSKSAFSLYAGSEASAFCMSVL